MPSNHQAAYYGRDHDYWSESPHLKHRHLYEVLTGRIDTLLREAAPDRQPEVLEIGAGDGAVTERLLALGCDVTGTEMSSASVDAMNERFGSNDRFRAVLDADGSLDALEGQSFDLILYASVLHHIPDYLGAIRHAIGGRLRPGGALATIQDPLWYPRLSPLSRKFASISYLSWRLTRGSFMRGLKTRVRRARHGLSEDAAGDAVEYHVVRDGVDELAIRETIRPLFEGVEIFSYWSSQGFPQQRAGELLDLKNTFAVFARGYHP